jgi:predicted AAA+ superfamily ATPase
VTDATLSLAALIRGSDVAISGVSPLRLPDYVDEVLRSGFPGIRDRPERARRSQLDGYLTRIVERELPDAGAVVRRPGALRAWMSAYGAATSTDASYGVILDAATAGESDRPARQTVSAYRDHLERLFVLDPLPAWTPALTPLKRLTRTPKHHVVDPALAARLSGLGADGLLRGEGKRAGATSGTWLGALFESLVTQSVRVYAQAAEASVWHLRTRGTEHEIDLIVEAPDGAVVAIEVKLAATVSDHDVRHLNWLHGIIGDRLCARLVITTGEFAYRRRDGVAVVPLALLGP